MPPLIEQRTIALSPPSDSDRRAMDQRIAAALGADDLRIPLPVLRKLPEAIRAGGGRLSCVIGRSGSELRLIDVGARRSYALALDLGTTNLVMLLSDNITGADVSTASCANPQIAFGGDILSRMHHAMLPGGDRVTAALRQGINDAIRSICGGAGISPAEVHGLVVAGNTVMSHFFLGLEISTIPVDPFVPVVRSPGFFTAAELGLELHPEAPVYVFPNAGSYVGGDITAGIIAAGIHESERPLALIDVGTNAEVVIGMKDWMLVGAGAAGPALEEGISRIGRRASGGVIRDITIRKGSVSCSTFDGLPPEGICGSGMVSLLAELYSDGIIDRSGAFIAGAAGVVDVDGERAFSISCGNGEPLLIRQGELQNFMKSKAAMFTLLLVLVRDLGLAFRDIEGVFVSGALGVGIDAAKAAAIGMLPAWPAKIVRPLGNTSLAGARMLLRDAGLLDAIDDLAGRITYKHMHDDPEFMKEFLGAVFIPHTNPDLLRAS